MHQTDDAIRALPRLAAWWTRDLPDGVTAVIHEALEESCEILGVNRAIAAWEEDDEPWVRISSLTGSSFDSTEEPPAKYDPFVDDEIADVPFFTQSASDSEVTILNKGTTTTRALQTRAIHPRLAERYAIASAFSLPLRSEDLRGRLFLLDVAPASVDLFMLGDLIAAASVGRAEQSAKIRAARADAVTKERTRVARDLHDGLLQSFTGVVLQIETVHKILEQQPEKARRMLTEIVGTIMSDQRELRSYVERLQPRGHGAQREFDFQKQLRELCDRMERQWGTNVTLRLDRIDPLVARVLGWETYKLILEAATNSAKHGGAQHIWIELETERDRLRLAISDDGTGFPFRGRYDLATLIEKQAGPKTLIERVGSLNGEIHVESTESGARVEMEIPLGWTSE